MSRSRPPKSIQKVDVEPKVPAIDKGIMYPIVDPNFYVEKPHQTILSIIDKMSDALPQNVMITGPQGCGKTELAVWFAAKYNRPAIIMNCATIRESKDWFGYRAAKEGSIFWHKAEFVRALESGNCVVVLDEFNRLHTTLHNTLYPLLDARRATYVEELDGVVKVGKKTVFFATCNVGFTHTGTFTIDSAMEDRWGIRVDLDFPPESTEAKILISKTGISSELANKLAKFAKNIRIKSQGSTAALSRALSTRQLLQSADLIKNMGTTPSEIRKALDYTIVPYYSKDGGKQSEQAQVLQLIQGVFGE